MASYFNKIDIDIEKGNTGSYDDLAFDENKKMLSADIKLQKYITKKILQPDYIKETEDLVEWRYKWRKYSDFLQSCSELCVIVSGILSFLSPALHDENLALSAGCIAFASVQLQNWSKKCEQKSVISTARVNELLRSLKIEEMPELLDDDDGTKTKDINTSNPSTSHS